MEATYYTENYLFIKGVAKLHFLMCRYWFADGLHDNVVAAIDPRS